MHVHGAQMLSGDFPFWEPGGDRSPWAVMMGILNGEVSSNPGL